MSAIRSFNMIYDKLLPRYSEEQIEKGINAYKKAHKVCRHQEMLPEIEAFCRQSVPAIAKENPVMLPLAPPPMISESAREEKIRRQAEEDKAFAENALARCQRRAQEAAGEEIGESYQEYERNWARLGGPIDYYKRGI